MLSCQPDVNDALETGETLLKDPDLAEEDRSTIQKEELDLSHRWKALEEQFSWKRTRYGSAAFINRFIFVFKRIHQFRAQHVGVDNVLLCLLSWDRYTELICLETFCMSNEIQT